VASRSCWKVIFLHEYIAGLLKAWGPGLCLGHANHSGEVRKAEEWEIVVVVGWSPGSKLLRLSLGLCERGPSITKNSLLHAAG